MRLRLLLVTVLLAAAGAVAASSTQAAVSWVVNGRGFGHGVGMSQYGAYGYALEGKGYRFILNRYYGGTKLGTLDKTSVVRVLVDISSGDVGFSGATGACGKTLDRTRAYEAHRSGSSVKLRTSSGKRLANCGPKLRAAGAGKIEIAGVGTYRGALEVVPTESDSGSLNAINAVTIDQYVKGVIANESPASWPQAALRAQAVAARSYALSTQVDGNGFDLYDDVSSQVYEGLSSETATTNQAAEATKGQVLTYGGEIAQTYFSACSGGHTESVQNVFFGTSIPYLVGVPDPYDYHCPLHSWTLTFTGPEISAKLGGYLDGALKRIVVTKRGASPRIIWANLYGTGGVTKIRGDQLAAALGGYDRWMSFRKLINGKAAAGSAGGATSGSGTEEPQTTSAGGAGAGAAGGAAPTEAAARSAVALQQASAR